MVILVSVVISATIGRICSHARLAFLLLHLLVVVIEIQIGVGVVKVACSILSAGWSVVVIGKPAMASIPLI